MQGLSVIPKWPILLPGIAMCACIFFWHCFSLSSWAIEIQIQTQMQIRNTNMKGVNISTQEKYKYKYKCNAQMHFAAPPSPKSWGTRAPFSNCQRLKQCAPDDDFLHFFIYFLPLLPQLEFSFDWQSKWRLFEKSTAQNDFRFCQETVSIETWSPQCSGWCLFHWTFQNITTVSTIQPTQMWLQGYSIY